MADIINPKEYIVMETKKILLFIFSLIKPLCLNWTAKPKIKDNKKNKSLIEKLETNLI